MDFENNFASNSNASQNRSTTMETVSMILGIVSIVLACCCGIGIIFGGLAIILGLLSRGNQSMGGMAIAGVIMGGIGIFAGIAGIFLLIIFMVAAEDTGTYYGQAIQAMNQISFVFRGGMI